MSINVRTTTVNTPLSSNFISPTLSEPINVQNHSTLVTNETLRALLPYRSMDDDLIFYNINSIGFGLQLMPKESIDIQTINTILSQLNTNLPYDLHCSMVLHKHHYTSRDTHSNYRCHLFFSCSNVHHRYSLAIYRERIEAQLYKHNLRPIRIDSIYFLIFLRTLISPNLQTTEWPALLDIHQKPFNYIIPNPGTRFNHFPNHLDILSPDHQGLFSSTKMIAGHVTLEDYPFEDIYQLPPWSLINFHDTNQSCDWVANISLCFKAHCKQELIQYDLLLFTTPNLAETYFLQAQKAYALCELALHRSNTTWASYIASLPFMGS